MYLQHNLSQTELMNGQRAAEQLKLTVTLILKKQGLGDFLDIWYSPKLFSHDAIAPQGEASNRALVLSLFLRLYGTGSGALARSGGNGTFLTVI